jgi:hypothetical protein
MLAPFSAPADEAKGAWGGKIVIERVTDATPEVRALVGELEDAHGRNMRPVSGHGLSIAQLFEPHVRFLVARLDASR